MDLNGSFKKGQEKDYYSEIITYRIRKKDGRQERSIKH